DLAKVGVASSSLVSRSKILHYPLLFSLTPNYYCLTLRLSSLNVDIFNDETGFLLSIAADILKLAH
ncbi:hypothetical protein, partial [Pectobacterium polaris]|uniref:hypothetical protein n=1 Tax=Pectobacterium polaris TaxID=2042057 RepID=UPI001CA4E0A3